MQRRTPRHEPPLLRIRKALPSDFKVIEDGVEREAELFKGVSPKVMNTLARHGTVYRARPNTILRSQPDPDEKELAAPLWFIVEGSCFLEVYPKGKPAPVGPLSAGAICGEIEAILKLPPVVSITTTTNFTYIDIDPPEIFMQVADEALLRNLCALFASKLRDRAIRLGVRRVRDIPTILNEYLRQVAAETGVDKKTNSLNAKISLREMAEVLDVSRQSIRNHLEALDGFEYRNQQIVVTDQKFLGMIKKR